MVSPGFVTASACCSLVAFLNYFCKTGILCHVVTKSCFISLWSAHDWTESSLNTWNQSASQSLLWDSAGLRPGGRRSSDFPSAPWLVSCSPPRCPSPRATAQFINGLETLSTISCERAFHSCVGSGSSPLQTALQVGSSRPPAGQTNQSTLKEISPEYSSEGLMLKLKLQYFGHLMRTADSLEKTLMLGKVEGGRRRGRQRMRWLGAVVSRDVALRPLAPLFSPVGRTGDWFAPWICCVGFQGYRAGGWGVGPGQLKHLTAWRGCGETVRC